MSDLLLGVAIAAVAGIVHGYSGFGGALLMVPLLSLFLSPVNAVAVTIVVAFMGQLSIAPRATRDANWSECGPFLFGALFALPLGSSLLIFRDARFIRQIFAVSTLIATCVLAFGWAYRGDRGPFVSGLFGVLGGAINGATGQGGPVAVAYFITAPVEEQHQRAAIITTVTGLISLSLVSLSIGGAISRELLGFGLVLSLPYLAGVWGGNRLFKFVPKENYRRATLALLFVAGLAALLK